MSATGQIICVYTSQASLRPLLTEVPAALVTSSQSLSSSNYNCTGQWRSKTIVLRVSRSRRGGSLSKFAAERIIRSRPVWLRAPPTALHCTRTRTHAGRSEPLPLHCTAYTTLHEGRSEPLPLARQCTYELGKPTSLLEGFSLQLPSIPISFLLGDFIMLVW